MRTTSKLRQGVGWRLETSGTSGSLIQADSLDSLSVQSCMFRSQDPLQSLTHSVVSDVRQEQARTSQWGSSTLLRNAAFAPLETVLCRIPRVLPGWWAAFVQRKPLQWLDIGTCKLCMQYRHCLCVPHRQHTSLKPPIVWLTSDAVH